MSNQPIKNSGAVKRKPNELVIDFGRPNPKQIEFFKSRTLYTAYGGARGGGKAVTNDTPICTPDGFKPMGEIKVGDYVIGRDGRPTRVIGVYPQGNVETYKFTFVDGASIITCGNHLWTAKQTCTRKGWRVYSTTDLLYMMHKQKPYQHLLIPMCDPIQWSKKEDLGIQPYTLGVLLGDGALTGKTIQFTSDDSEIAQFIERDGYHVVKYKSKYAYGIRKFQREAEWLKKNTLCVKSEFKYVPKQYLFSDYETRLCLLQGLMDTDGYADDRGHVEFATVSKQLAEDVQFLVRSIGGKATVSIKEENYAVSDNESIQGLPVFRVYIRIPKNYMLFRLPRKRDRCFGKDFNGGISDFSRRIVSIVPNGIAECTCIRVDADDALFVAKDFIVTHNSWAVRTKAVGGALEWPGIRILIIRRTYPELQQNHVEPIIKMIPGALATYNGSLRTMYFKNGSYIKFGHANSLDTIEREYQGQEYDWIFMDEATQFTYQEFRTLGGCLRGVNDIPKRFYLTCNPGGIGHKWVKRLFIDRDFQRSSTNPEENENPKDYLFIAATIDDNIALLNSNGGKAYKQMLSALPEKIRQAHRYGDWNALSGAYFSEFKRGIHTCAPFPLNRSWLRYRAFDYGLDRFAAYWIAVSPEGRSYVYREFCESNMIVSEAAQALITTTPEQENIVMTFAPPDIWNRQKDTGKSMAELFMLSGIPIVRADNSRVQGHMQIKEMMTDLGDHKPGLIIFDTCKELIDSLEIIQADDNNPNDCAKEPHDITHSVDALRYYAISRVLYQEEKPKQRVYEIDEKDEEDYDEAMTGGAPDRSYLGI